MEERKPLVSVIVPVYNVYPYLRDCVQSVQAQSYQNWELLLVDDGSTDGSGELCDELTVEDGRIRVFHKPNGGLSDARNHGMHHARGEYFCFLDSDDFLEKKAVERLVGLCEEYDADVAIGAFREVTEEVQKNVQKNVKADPSIEILSAEETLQRMFLHQGIGHSAWAKLYRRSCWDGWEFPKGMLYEDYAAVYKVISGCKTVAITKEIVYNYRIRNNSIMHQAVQEKNLMILDVARDVTLFVSERIPVLREEAEYLELVTNLKTLKGILDGGFDNYPHTQKKICKFVRDHHSLIQRPWAKREDIIKVKALLWSKRLFYSVYALNGFIRQKRNKT